jgi:adenylate cyclase
VHPANDSHIVLCGMTDEDLVKYGHPLDDARLASLLDGIVAGGPCVVGLDIYRDLPEPRSGAYYPKLAEALQRLDGVIAIERVGRGQSPGIKPPAVLVGNPDRVAPNNLPFDRDGVYRRAYLFLEEGLEEPRESLALVLAETYLAANGVKSALIDGPRGQLPLLRLGQVTFPRLTPNAGAYSGLNISDYETLVDYRAPAKGYHYGWCSFGDVLEKRVPPERFKGAIVIVGGMTDSVKDNNPTPVHASMRGLIQHATIVNQLLRAGLDGEPPTRWWSEPGNIAWISLWTLAGGALGLGVRKPWKLGIAMLVLLAGVVFAGRAALLHALWIPTTTPALGGVAAAALVTSMVAFFEHSDRQALRGLFSRHVSKEVASTLWVERDQFLDGGRLKPQRITATVLFTDLRDYSTISEKMDAAALMNWINEYMNAIASQVSRHHGIVISYIGDAIMAMFGAPVPHETESARDRDACNAVECALAMRRVVRELNANWKSRGMPTVGMRVGVFTGDLVTGSIGCEERLEYTALGDTANTAARLESLGKEVPDTEMTAPCTILIGESTWQRVRERFNTELIGPKVLKGKKQQVIVHSVLSAKLQGKAI